MRKHAFAALLVATVVFGLAAGQAPASRAVPQGATPVALKDKYHAVEVEKFDVQKGVEFPPEYIQPLQDEILKQFQKWDKFKEVLRGGEKPADAAAPVLRLTGTVTYFDPGSRGKRYVGFGLGHAEVLVHIVFVDRATGETIISDDIRGILAGGLFGGETKNVTGEFAHQLITTTKLLLEKPVPVRAEFAPEPPAGGLPPTAVSRHVVTISSENFDQAQVELNREAAGGYRLVGFAHNKSKSKTADVTMELSATPPPVYQYRLVHVRWFPSFQKDLNKAGEEGYRYSPHTLAQLPGTVAFAIIEKPPTSSKIRYQYRVHSTLLLSSAQKDIQKDQGEGFSLAATLEISGMPNIVLMEKAIEKAGE